MTEIALGAVVCDGRLLVRERRGDPRLGGTWELPGGKRRPDESIAEAAVREVAEETGLDVEAGDLLVALSHRYPDRTVSLYAYLCTRLETGADGTDIEWITPAEYRARPHPAANPAIVEALEWELRRVDDRQYEPEPSCLDKP